LLLKSLFINGDFQRCCALTEIGTRRFRTAANRIRRRMARAIEQGEWIVPIAGEPIRSAAS
jgi:hypothetical protein